MQTKVTFGVCELRHHSLILDLKLASRNIYLAIFVIIFGIQFDGDNLVAFAAELVPPEAIIRQKFRLVVYKKLLITANKPCKTYQTIFFLYDINNRFTVSSFFAIERMMLQNPMQEQNSFLLTVK
jgi:hypothetical protein